jgi:outer membrane receptor protein involved in Fe transport
MRWDSYNVDRIDLQCRPNSNLFGLGSPAGIINASTRSAEFRNNGSAAVRAVSATGDRRLPKSYFGPPECETVK